jgi:hypothetical protein
MTNSARDVNFTQSEVHGETILTVLGLHFKKENIFLQKYTFVSLFLSGPFEISTSNIFNRIQSYRIAKLKYETNIGLYLINLPQARCYVFC